MKWIVVFLPFLMAASCQTPSFTLQDYTGKRLILGNGGGFTGHYTEYILFENGQLFKKTTLDGTIMELSRMNRELTGQIFSNFDILGLSEIKLHDPGNMNYYISVITNGAEQKLLWNTDSDEEKIRSARLFYLTALKRIQASTNQVDAS